jgi:hypothetical protein
MSFAADTGRQLDYRAARVACRNYVIDSFNRDKPYVAHPRTNRGDVFANTLLRDGAAFRASVTPNASPPPVISAGRDVSAGPKMTATFI